MHFSQGAVCVLTPGDMSCNNVTPGVLFTESALRPIQSISRDVRMFVCLSLCLSVRHTLETTLPDGLETSGRRAYR